MKYATVQISIYELDEWANGPSSDYFILIQRHGSE